METIKIEAMLTSAYKDKEYGFTDSTGKRVEGKSTGAYFIIAGKQAKLKISPEQVDELLALKNQTGKLELEIGVYKETLSLKYKGFEW